MTAVAAVHDVPLARCELPVRGSERRRETATPERQRAVSGRCSTGFHSGLFRFWFFFVHFYFYPRLWDCKCTFRPFRRGITGSLAKHRNALQSKGRKKLRVAVGFRGWEDTTTTHLFSFRFKTTAEFLSGDTAQPLHLLQRVFAGKQTLSKSDRPSLTRTSTMQNKTPVGLNF